MQARGVLAKAVRLAMIAGAASASVTATNAFASDEGEKVERIQVTGSRIKRTDLETANPITSISAEDLSKQGFTNVQDALENLSSTTGAITTQSVHGFTPAASAISLRGAGANRTLTLINGKRLNQYPKALGGTSNFVDTANLPMEAVARIEVLKSGASAIYGADAVGGVVNIILKKDFEGIALKYRHGDTTQGGGMNDRLALSLGSSNDKGNLSSFIEFSSSEQLKATQRADFGLDTDKVPYSEYSSYSSYGSRIAGGKNTGGQRQLTADECTAGEFLWDEENLRCGYDRTKQRDLGPESYRFISTTTFNYELNDDTSFVGRIDFAKAKSTTHIEPSATNDVDVVIDGDDLTVNVDGLTQTYKGQKNVALGGDFADAKDGEYAYIRRLHELGQRQTETNTQNYFGSFGLEGMLADEYSWDASVNYGKTDLDQFNSGYTTYQKLFDYVTEGKYGQSLLDPISDSAASDMQYSPVIRASTNQTNIQVNISGLAFELPAGDAGFAAGAEWTEMEYQSSSDSELSSGNVVGSGGSSGQGKRRFWAVYSELEAPLLDELTMNLALRYDRYSDFGGNLTPSVNFEYRPTDELLVRASYNKVFRAPDMQRVYGDPTEGFTQVIDYKRCAELGGTPGEKSANNEISEVCNELHIDSTTGANKDLDAEKGYSVNVGTVYSDDELNISVDIWKWKLDGIVSTVSASKAAREFEDYEFMITRDEDGKITHINSTARNLAFQEVTGLDLEAGYAFDLNDLGELNIKVNGSYLIDSQSQIDPTADVLDDIAEGGLPKYKGNVQFTWKLEDFQTTLGAYHTARHRGISYSPDTPYETASHTKWNLTGTYYVSEDIVIKSGVINLFNKAPNFDPTYKSWPHYDRSLFNARGREWFVETEVKF
ncbi:TonB-dependent receptor [Shewanella sp. OPT22]|nr:TonB-dependent receptor [Shewanella sp. OPT22]